MNKIDNETKEQILEKRERFQAKYRELLKPFPAEAYSVDSSRGFNLTSIKAQYVVERLNEVMGVDGWELVGNFEKEGTGVLFIGKLVLNDGFSGHSQLAVGYSDTKKNIGDAYKGAMTDALSKAASKFGLGNEVFKGNVAPPVKGSASKPKLKSASGDF